MKKVAVTFLLPGLIASLLLSTGCSTSTSISDIKDNPSQYYGQEVTVQGTVGGRFWFALLTKGTYELTNDTGSIWVICQHTPPETGAEVRVRGTVEQAASMGEYSGGVAIIETDREQIRAAAN